MVFWCYGCYSLWIQRSIEILQGIHTSSIILFVQSRCWFHLSFSWWWPLLTQYHAQQVLNDRGGRTRWLEGVKPQPDQNRRLQTRVLNYPTWLRRRLLFYDLQGQGHEINARYLEQLSSKSDGHRAKVADHPPLPVWSSLQGKQQLVPGCSRRHQKSRAQQNSAFNDPDFARQVKGYVQVAGLATGHVDATTVDDPTKWLEPKAQRIKQNAIPLRAKAKKASNVPFGDSIP